MARRASRTLGSLPGAGRDFRGGCVEQGARSICAGRLVAFPTETVCGLGADATDDHAVAAVFKAKAKGRPRFNHLIVYVAGWREAEALAVFRDRARRARVLARNADRVAALLHKARLVHQKHAVRKPSASTA